jgi:hypothetical protein
MSHDLVTGLYVSPRMTKAPVKTNQFTSKTDNTMKLTGRQQSEPSNESMVPLEHAEDGSSVDLNV